MCHQEICSKGKPWTSCPVFTGPTYKDKQPFKSSLFRFCLQALMFTGLFWTPTENTDLHMSSNEVVVANIWANDCTLTHPISTISSISPPPCCEGDTWLLILHYVYLLIRSCLPVLLTRTAKRLQFTTIVSGCISVTGIYPPCSTLHVTALFATNALQTLRATLAMVYLFTSISPEFVDKLEIMTFWWKFCNRGMQEYIWHRYVLRCDEKEKKMLVL